MYCGFLPLEEVVELAKAKPLKLELVLTGRDAPSIEIATWGSINEAEKRLFISQPSLSNAIKELEAELNITIFERTNKEISISVEGVEFLGYARQVLEQTELLENRYLGAKPTPQHFSVSTQHYAFSVNAFVNLIKRVSV